MQGRREERKSRLAANYLMKAATGRWITDERRKDGGILQLMVLLATLALVGSHAVTATSSTTLQQSDTTEIGRAHV